MTTAGTGSGGHLMLGGPSINNANVTFAFANNTAGLNSGIIEFNEPSFVTGTATSQIISNAGFGDSFVFGQANFTGDTYTYSGTTLTVKSGVTTVLTMNNLSLGTGASGFSLSGNTIEVLCFVAGTRIATNSGTKAVETLQPGDLVVTVTEEGHVEQSVKWIGRRRIDLTTHPRPEMVAPIRIMRDAFAKGVPARDLLVSPDHGMFANGMLICARQLVNGTTICQERDWKSVECFHVELEAHAIPLAEGLASESYLDTGNRGFFSNSEAPHILHPDLTDESNHPAREAGSCVPFVWQEDSVRPVWEMLAARALDLGHTVPQPETTADPDFAVVAGGKVLRPLRAVDGRYQFVLPPGIGEVQLVSRAASPNDAKPWIEDRRLGVYVERMQLRAMNDVLDLPLDYPLLSRGWWAVERTGTEMRRWTNGNAVVPLPQLDGPTVLEIAATSSALAYVIEPELQRRAA